MSTKTQLLKEAKMLETKLANVNKQINKIEKLRMQMLAGVITESQYKARLSEEEGNEEELWTVYVQDFSHGEDDDMTYYVKGNSSEEAKSYLLSFFEENGQNVDHNLSIKINDKTPTPKNELEKYVNITKQIGDGIYV
jgi:hypothetical protein